MRNCDELWTRNGTAFATHGAGSQSGPDAPLQRLPHADARSELARDDDRREVILRQDPELSPGATASAVVIAADDEGSFDALLSVAEPLAQRPARELIVTRPLTQVDRLATATSELAELRSALADRGVTARGAAYVAGEAGAEAARFATEHNADLLLVDAASPLVELALERAPCDVGLLARRCSSSRWSAS